jgi:hypothetical protein
LFANKFQFKLAAVAAMHAVTMLAEAANVILVLVQADLV